MKAAVPALALILAASVAVAQTGRPVTPQVPQVVAPKATAPATSTPANPFPLECVAVPRVIGAGTSYSFQCQKADGSVTTVTVARGYDTSGTYPVGHEAQTTAALNELYSVAAIAATVNAFIAMKAAQPATKSVLDLAGFPSKLPAANGGPVVSSATLVVK